MAHQVFMAALGNFLAQIPTSSSAARSSWSQSWWQFQSALTWLTAWTQHPNLAPGKRKSERNRAGEKLPLWKKGKIHWWKSSSGWWEWSPGIIVTTQGTFVIVKKKLIYSSFTVKAPLRLLNVTVLVLFPALRHELRPFSVFAIPSSPP